MTTKLTEADVKLFAMTVGQVADHIREWSGEIINTRDRTQNAHDMLDKANVYEINGTHTGLLNRIGILIRERDSLKQQLAEATKEPKLIWFDGEPDKIRRREWFIATLDDGVRVVLRSLPEELSYDYKTADETYYKANRIKRWMQFPDSEFIAPEATKPVGDEELEKVIERLDKDKTMIELCGIPPIRNDLYYLVRAARQRKPSVDVIAMAQWVSDNRRFVGNIGAIKGADSILAQAAAGKTKPNHDWRYGEEPNGDEPGVACVPAADSTVGAATDYGYFSTPIFMTDPLEIEKASAKIEEAQKNPTVTFSGVNTSWSKLNGAVDAIRKLLGDCAMIFRDGTLRDREEGEPHADVDGTSLRPAADLLTAMERKDLEFARAKDFRQIITWETAVDYLICMIDRLAPEPSAATPTEVKP